MGLLLLKEGVAEGNTPPKVYLVALERLCGSLTMLREKFRSVVEVRIEKIRLTQSKQNELHTYLCTIRI